MWNEFLLTSQQVRELDRRAIQEYGIQGTVLMENAGRLTAEWLVEQLIQKNQTSFPSLASLDPQNWPEEHRTIAIFTGAGNNAGDGYVIARHLLNKGFQPLIFFLFPPEKLKGDALVNYELVRNEIPQLYPCLDEKDFLQHEHKIKNAAAIVDAIFGTGLTRPLEGWFLSLIRKLNSFSHPLKLAVDIPSGLDANTGHPMPLAFKADLTATFAFIKVGMRLPSALDYVGEIQLIDIGIPFSLMHEVAQEAFCRAPSSASLQQTLRKRPLNSHKGTFGHLLVIGGSKGKTGAPLLASLAALRTGAGLCTLASTTDVIDKIEATIPEVMYEPFEDFEQQLKPLFEKKNAILVGPGLSQGDFQKELLAFLLEESPLPLVIDADGLNVLAGQLDLLKKFSRPIIITPHVGEMARLRGVSTDEIRAQRFLHARVFAEEYGVFVVLKDARTLIASPKGDLSLNLTGNPALATAGTGDVLAGMIASLLAQNYSPLTAALLGVFLHGYTADFAIQTMGTPSLLASDIAHQLPTVLAQWN